MVPLESPKKVAAMDFRCKPVKRLVLAPLFAGLAAAAHAGSE